MSSQTSIPTPLPSAHTAPTHGPPLPPNCARLPQTKQLDALLTIIRDKNTNRSDFIFYSDRIIRLLVEEGQSMFRIRSDEHRRSIS